MATTTAAERALLPKFREEMKGSLDTERLADDQFLLRWIRARDHNLEKAKLMLQNHLKWYAEKEIEAILRSPVPALFATHFPNYIEGQDREGRTLFVAMPGRWNMRELLRCASPEDFLREYVRLLEKLVARLAEARVRAPPDAPFPQAIGITDFHGFGWAQANSWPAISRLLDMASTIEGHYPEIMDTLYFVNCPRIFMWVIPLLKRAMPERTASKLHVYGTDKDEWWPVLTNLIEPKYLQRLHGAEAVNGAASGNSQMQ